MPDEGGSPWAADTLTDDGRDLFYKAALDRRASAEMDSRKVRQLGLIFGCAGLMMGLVGVVAGASVYLKTPVPPPPGWIFVDKSTGVIDPPVAARDAPRLFPETIRDRALRDFITACESYVPETWARLDFHACMIMATPAEQKRRADDIGRDGSRYPPKTFGPAGWAMPSAFQAFTRRDVTGVEPNQTFHYQVRYERTEISAGKETRPRWTADVYFQFHPELKMTDPDRLLNPYGFQAIAFSTTRD